MDVSQANLGPMYRCLLTLVPLTTAVKNNRPKVVSLFEGQTWWWCMKTSHSGVVYLTGHRQVTNAHLLKLQTQEPPPHCRQSKSTISNNGGELVPTLLVSGSEERCKQRDVTHPELSARPQLTPPNYRP